MSRADRIADCLADRGIDLLLVTDGVNLRYATGFTGSNGMAVIGRDVRRFITDFRYVEQAAVQVPHFDREQAPQAFLSALADGWPDGPIRLGFDDADVSVAQHRRLQETLPDRVELVPAGGVIEQVRLVKDPEEIDAIRAAAAVVDEVYGWLVERGVVGRTEREVAVALEHRMRELGASGPSFSSIVASGPHGALPHAVPRDVEIVPDTLLTLDIGAELDGYCSDCTRTWATGENLPDELLEIYSVCERAQVDSLMAVLPGVEGRAVDAVARDVIGGAGYGDNFGHGLGHGVGMEVHEGPRLARSAADILQVGMVVTVEPGIYLPGVGGVRIEDLVVVREGAAEVLSTQPKTLTTVA